MQNDHKPRTVIDARQSPTPDDAGCFVFRHPDDPNRYFRQQRRYRNENGEATLLFVVAARDRAVMEDCYKQYPPLVEGGFIPVLTQIPEIITLMPDEINGMLFLNEATAPLTECALSTWGELLERIESLRNVPPELLRTMLNIEDL
jgi:hypothetical protein